jgi:hypothetical protein
MSERFENVPPYLLAEGAKDADVVYGLRLLVAEEACLVGIKTMATSSVRHPMLPAQGEPQEYLDSKGCPGVPYQIAPWNWV